MSLILLTTIDDVITANLLKSKLESEGILCFLHNENISNLIPNYHNILGGGVKVMVPPDQLERAKEIAALDTGNLTCPNCGSENISNQNAKGIRKLGMILMALFLLAPIGNFLNNYSCNACNHQFKK